MSLARTTPARVDRIDRRLSFAFIGLCVAAILFYGVVIGALAIRGVDQERERLSSVPVRLLAPGLAAAKAAGQFRMQRVAEDARLADGSILYVRVTDETGVLVQAGPAPDGEGDAPWPADAPADDVRLRELEVGGVHVTESSVPLVGGFDGAWRGVLRLGVVSEPVTRVALRVVSGAALMLLGLLATVVPMAWWFGRRLGAPVQRLARDFAGILEHTSLYLVIEDEQGRVVHASDAVRRGFGLDVEGRSTRDVLGLPADAPLAGEVGVVVQGAPLRLHLVRFPVELAPDGRPARFGLVGTDVTAIRAAEAERARLAAAIEATDDCVMVVATRTGVLYANPALYALTGLERVQVTGKDAVSVLAGDDEARDALRRHAAGPWRGQILAQRVGAPPWHCALSISPIEGADCEVWVARDVSREFDLESQLRQSQKMEAIGQLAGGIAHDFNNLLTVVLSSAELLLRSELTSSQRSRVTMISQAGARAAELTRQLLAFGRRQALHMQVVQLGEVVTRTSAMLRRVIGASVELSIDVPPGLWPIEADPGQLEQVLMNLAINARDAMPSGGVLGLGVSNARLDRTPTADGAVVPTGDYVVLRVSDTGTGMSRETLSHIFEPFFTTKAAGQGTGLGLATVLGIVRQSRAYIWVYSEPGRGTVFRIAFPRGAPAEPAAAPETPALAHGAGEHVLLVEDEPMVRSALEAILLDGGYRVTCAPDGVAAVALLDRGLVPDVVLSDVVMPRMGGIELRRIVAERLGTPVVLMSGYSAETADPAGFEESELLCKPPSQPEVWTAIQRALQRRAKPR